MDTQTSLRRRITAGPSRRIAKVHLSEYELRALLDLPDDVRAVHISGTADPSGIIVMVEGDRFDEVDPRVEAPYAPGSWMRVGRMVDGKLYHRLEWEPTGSEAVSA